MADIVPDGPAGIPTGKKETLMRAAPRLFAICCLIFGMMPSLRAEASGGAAIDGTAARPPLVLAMAKEGGGPGCIGGHTLSYTLAAGFGQMFSYDLTSGIGYPPYSCTIASGTLPPGISLDTAGCKIYGVPRDIGTFKITVTAKDSCSQDRSGTVTVYMQVACSGASCSEVPCTPLSLFQFQQTTYPWLAKGFVGSPYAAQLFSGGRNAKVTKITANGRTGLPPGLSLDVSTGKITGTPLEYARGEHKLDFEVTDGCPSNTTPRTGTATLKIVETIPPNIQEVVLAPLSLDSRGGEVTLKVKASDNIAVYHVIAIQIQPNGYQGTAKVPLVTGTPQNGEWLLKWTMWTNGSSSPQYHTIKVKAEDADGNVAEAPAIVLTVAGTPSTPLRLPTDPQKLPLRMPGF